VRNNSIAQSRDTVSTNTAPVPVIANPRARNLLHLVARSWGDRRSAVPAFDGLPVSFGWRAIRRGLRVQ